MSVHGGIVLQKSKVAGLKIFRENTKQRAIADSYDLNRVTEVACEFCVSAMRSLTSCTRKSHPRPAEFWPSAKNEFCHMV